MSHLSKGIFLEDTNIILEWGQPLGKLAEENGGEVIKEADRLIINWGVHRILNGLEINLSNTFLGTPNFHLKKEFTTISAWAVGDSLAKDFFNRVAAHLISLFGEPEKENLKDEREACWNWYTDTADFTLYLFEQHCFKASLTIEQNL